MEVEEDDLVDARVAEGVQRVRRGGGERSRPRRDDLPLGAEGQLELALEHVEGIGVVVVDVGVRALLARRVPEPSHDRLVELAEDPQRLRRPVGDDLALAGR